MACSSKQFTMRRSVSFADLPGWLQDAHSLRQVDGRLWWDLKKKCWKVGTPNGVRQVLYGDVICMDHLGNLTLVKEDSYERTQ